MMHLDPELVRAKRGSQIREWMRFATADTLVDEWHAAEAQAEAERAARST
jgi:hypothetical protein